MGHQVKSLSAACRLQSSEDESDGSYGTGAALHPAKGIGDAKFNDGPTIAMGSNEYLITK